MPSLKHKVLSAVGLAGKVNHVDAFEAIDALGYSKSWDTSGDSIKLRESWTDSEGNVVREVTHDYAEDNTIEVPQ